MLSMQRDYHSKKKKRARHYPNYDVTILQFQWSFMDDEYRIDPSGWDKNGRQCCSRDDR